MNESDQQNAFEAACREWVKECSCVTRGRPWECAVCTAGFHARLMQLIGPEGVTHYYSLPNSTAPAEAVAPVPETP